MRHNGLYARSNRGDWHLDKTIEDKWVAEELLESCRRWDREKSRTWRNMGLLLAIMYFARYAAYRNAFPRSKAVVAKRLPIALIS